MTYLLSVRLTVLEAAAFPNPKAKQPPGVAGLVNIVGYAVWAFTLVCVVALIVAAGRMALSHHRGEPVGQGIVIVLIAAVIGSSAGPILTAVTT